MSATRTSEKSPRRKTAAKAQQSEFAFPDDIAPEAGAQPADIATQPADEAAKKKKSKKSDTAASEAKDSRKEKPRKQFLKNEAKSFIDDVRFGRSISIDFFKTNAWLLIIMVGGMIGMMGLRYKNKTKMAEIKQLNIELTRAKSAKLKEKSEYMSLIRETEMKRLVEENHLGLEFRSDPPVTIPLNAD